MNVAVHAALADTFGAVRDVRAVGGGCISPAFRVRLAAGDELFVKTAGRDWPVDAFAEEARSLARLLQAGTLPVPNVRGVAGDWLALEWLEPAPSRDAGWVELGSGLARLHRVTAPAAGWEADNYIGPLPQANGAAPDWPSFWRTRRLEPLIVRAEPLLDGATRRDLDDLLEALPDLLTPAAADGMSLLHGDLWSGNVHMCVRGPALVDPASCYGHREVDLAMAALFGGFPRSFFAAYRAEWPLQPGAERRRHVYQLYYLLVHVVLFGGGYAAGTAAAVRAALR